MERDAHGHHGTGVPGKRTLTMALPPVRSSADAPIQRKQAGPVADDDRARPASPGEPGVVASAGKPLPADVQAKMEGAMGADFSAVRIHEGHHVSAVRALGYTKGTDIHFAPGQYDPHSARGQELLGHELAHVVQQTQGRVQATAQAKGLAINSDPSLEREADELGGQAARGERATSAGGAPHTPHGPVQRATAASTAAPIQRFTDPDTSGEIDPETIEHYADALRYAKMVQTKQLTLTVSEFKKLMLRLKQLEAQKLGATIAEGMELANAPAGPKYVHRVPPETLSELVHAGHDPNLGYADPAFFDRLSKFTWRVKPNVSAAAALNAFISPDNVTVSECQTALQATFYYAILRAVGTEKFDAKLGSADVTVPESQRLLLQMDFQSNNPMGQYLEDTRLDLDPEEKSELSEEQDGHLASRPDFRPAKVGGWYYMKNHAFYSERHRGGLWGGENVIYVGRDEYGHQIFSGFGLPNRTEEEMAEVLAGECNEPPSPERTEALFIARKFGLALPRLGDLTSIATMPMTMRMIDTIDKLWSGKGRVGGKSPSERLAKDRLKGLMKEMELPPPVTAADILHVIHTNLNPGMGEDAQNESLQQQKKHLRLEWRDGTTARGTPCKQMTIAKTTENQVRVPRSQLVKYYCEQFNLEYLATEMCEAFNILNPGTPLNIDIQTHTFRFPPPEVFFRRHKTPGGFQTLGGKVISIDKLKQEFSLNHLFDTEG